MKKINKPGYGSFSLLFLLLAFLWSFSINEFCIGDVVLRFFGLDAWSNTGAHYTIIYSLFLIIPAFLLAEKYPNDLFAKTVRFCSLILWILILLFILLCTVGLILE